MITEQIQFRVLSMPCCSHILYWLGFRLPNHCPECGREVYTKLKFNAEHTLISDEEARIKYREVKL